MTFGRKGLPKLDEQEREKLAFAYLTALDEIEALVQTIKERLSNSQAPDQDSLKNWHTILVHNHTRILTVAKNLPPADSELPNLVIEADRMEGEISKIAESLWGFDEARVSGLLLASGILGSNV